MRILYRSVASAHFFFDNKKPYIIRTTSVGNLDFMLARSDLSIQGRIKHIVTPIFLWRDAINNASRIVMKRPVLIDKAATYGLNNCELIQSGADPERFRSASNDEKKMLRKQLDLPDNKIILVATGRYVKGGNLIALIKAAELIEQDLPGKVMVMIIVATERNLTTSNKDEIKHYVSDHGIAHM